MFAKHNLYNYKIRPIRVIDGDSVEVEIDVGFNMRAIESIRLYDIDTPEIRGRNASIEGKWATLLTKLWFQYREKEYEELRQFTIEEAEQRAESGVPFVGGFFMNSRDFNPRGKYGRVLGEIYRGNDVISLNAFHAVKWPAPSSW